MKKIFTYLLKISAILISFALIGLLLFVLKLSYFYYKAYQFSKTLPPITRPIRNTNYKEKTTVTFSGGYARMYQADVPNEFIRLGGGWPVALWLTYPDFKGHTPYFNDITVDRTKIVHFYLGKHGGIDDFPEDKLQARYGQKGVQALFDVHWKLTHILSEQQPYGNPKEYTVKWKPEHKDYIYDAGDFAIRIDCEDRYIVNNPCRAYQRWGATPIVIEYGFDESLLADFGHIQAEINKLLLSFNIRENPNFYSQKEMAFRKRVDTPTFYYCRPKLYDSILDDVEAIIISKNKKWQSPHFINALVQEYIPVGCSLSEVKEEFKHISRLLDNLKSVNVEQTDLPDSNEVIFNIPLFNTQFLYWLRPNFWFHYVLEIKIKHKEDRIESVTTQIK